MCARLMWSPRRRNPGRSSNYEVSRLGASPPMVFMTGQGSISISSANKNPAGVSARQAWHVVHRQWRQPAFPQSGDCDDEEYSASSSPCRDSAGRCDPSHPLSNSLSSLCGSSRRQRSAGWRVDGKLVCYYHPGDIADAWADDHAGVSPEIWEACYQLGTNVIFYAHSEYSKWLSSRGTTKE